MTKEQLWELAKQFPQKWSIENDRVTRCFVVPIDGHTTIVCANYGRFYPINSKVYDTKAEAKSALDEKMEKRRKQIVAAIEVVRKYIRRAGWSINKEAEKNKGLKELLAAAAGYVDRKRDDTKECIIQMMRAYIHTGTINMSGRCFRKDEVSMIRYGNPTDSWNSDTTPIELTLRGGEKVITRTKSESAFIQDIFGKNRSERIWTNIKWPED